MTKTSEDRAWTLDETVHLIRLAPHNTAEQIGAALNRTATAVQHKAGLVGVSINHAHATSSAGLEASIGWTEARVEQLKAYWREGLSATQIAKLLTGVTRNAVIGKVHREGLALRAEHARSKKPVKVKPAPPIKVAADPPKPRATAARFVIPDTLQPLKREDGSTFGVLDVDDSTCRYPFGDPLKSGFAFCGRAVFARSYCVGHNAIAFQAGSAKHKRQAERAYAPVHELARVMASGTHGSRQ